MDASDDIAEWDHITSATNVFDAGIWVQNCTSTSGQQAALLKGKCKGFQFHNLMNSKHVTKNTQLFLAAVELQFAKLRPFYSVFQHGYKQTYLMVLSMRMSVPNAHTATLAASWVQCSAFPELQCVKIHGSMMWLLSEH